MTEHSHIMGGSTAKRRIFCPGSLKLEQEIPDSPSSEFADRGSMLHAATELILIEDPADMKAAEKLFPELLGLNMGYEGHDITQELIDTKIRPAIATWFDIDDTYHIEDFLLEKRLSLEWVVPGAYGTADVIALDEQNQFHTIDWKFGDGVPVPVEKNFGLAFYTACAVYDDDAELKEFLAPFDKVTQDEESYLEHPVTFHIVQPRVGFDQNHFEWPTTFRFIDDFVQLAAKAAKLAVSDKPPLKAGDWCRWCKAQPTCPAFNKIASAALSTDPKRMGAAELASALENARLLKPWIDSVFKLATEELEGGAAIPGWKLVPKRASRSWADAEAAEQGMRKARMKVGDIFKQTLISPAQLETKDKKVYGRLRDLVESRSSGLTLAEDSDSREGVSDGMALLSNAMEKAGH